ncbi:hypothetical protein LY76DRAFT_175931 [Colletotrichum caudatum]|nr:hypothetical protein LY76DRAFT_175931 [Colletotrichum caudatum]
MLHDTAPRAAAVHASAGGGGGKQHMGPAGTGLDIVPLPCCLPNFPGWAESTRSTARFACCWLLVFLLFFSLFSFRQVMESQVTSRPPPLQSTATSRKWTLFDRRALEHLECRRARGSRMSFTHSSLS